MAASEITAAAEGFVRISGLGKVFRREEGSVQVLRNVSITVPNRQFISILGASGCGKTTLLMMLAGLESITSGTIEIARQPVTKPRRDVGIIFQDPTLLPWKTALENVLFPIEIFGLPLAEYRPRVRPCWSWSRSARPCTCARASCPEACASASRSAERLFTRPRFC